MKKYTLPFVIAILLSVVTACSGGGQASEGGKEAVTLDFMTNASEGILETYREIAENYQKENPDITVKVTSQGKDFEALMKAKMASNDLPDLWSTHGWSVERYSEHLVKVNDQPWFDKVKEPIIPAISKDNGDVFVLPLDIDQSGVVVNKDVLEEAGVNIDDLKTWDDFVSAFEKVKGIGKVPVGIGGKDPRQFAHFLDVMATPLYISSEKHNYADALLDGTFDWSKWSEASELLLSLKENEYLNKDALTASPDAMTELMARNEVAFLFANNGAVTGTLEFNPDANVGFVPIPAVHEGDAPVLIGGERDAVGVWKNSEHKEEALKFLAYLAQPENVQAISEEQGMPPALEGVESDLGKLTDDYKKYEDVPVEVYFDRVYLPGGMWSTLQTVGSGLVSGDISVEKAIQTMENDDNRLRKETEQ
ncbi:extracellular solute-binding protein [Bacillaceae bacterium SIJ1]|uniref:ABC transporter substrate-binding protein n=1 Tax=Litoribacterium kuwaitense TaxID=1398745 RepID=UPI0013EB89B2|nr:extracellular solute-binding protein [Litoribacterium kuwaitense]NGP46205.1 extracellular solute-binding protein [Litoribacterium kuwaitense]